MHLVCDSMKNQELYTEKKLITLCKKKDRRAQKYLFDSQAPVMLTLCKRYIGDHSTAEEIMIIGFMKVFEKLEQYKDKGSFQGWIRRVMVTTCLEWIRKNKNIYKELDVDEVEYMIDIQEISDALEVNEILDLINELPQGYRTVFNLHAIEGYNHEEIGEMLEISPNTSKSQLSRARKLLQSIILNNEKIAAKKVGNGY